MQLAKILSAVAAVLLGASHARASCADPRGCYTDICSYPGNVVELTVLDASAGPGATIIVRIDAVHVIDALRFAVPVVGSELEISEWRSGHRAGDRLVGLAREPNNVGWPLFRLTGEDAVGCLGGYPSTTITIAEVESLVRLGRCDQGDPLPRLTGCDDEGVDCASSGNILPGSIILLALVRLGIHRWTKRKVSAA